MNQVAKTIIKQLGGFGRLKAMIDAKQFVTTDNGIQFKFKRSNGINCVSIELNGKDYYDLVFYSVRGIDWNEVVTVPDVAASLLRNIFEDKTGLYLSL